MEKTFLIFVDVKDGTQSNKYYNMIPSADTFTVHYGRVGGHETTKTYPIYKWNSTYRSKIKKGYKDVTHLKNAATIKVEESSNLAFNDFYSVFSQYTSNFVRSVYLTEGCTEAQLKEAQSIINRLTTLKNVDDVNDSLLELYKVIPRRMSDVRRHLMNDLSGLPALITKEQDALDSMDSNNITQVTNPLAELNIDFEEFSSNTEEFKEMEKLLYPTMGNSYRRATIHKVYGVSNQQREVEFKEWLGKQENKQTNFLIHGTRNPNVFSILKSGLLVRPSNAASFAGSAYGDGIYHSAHSQKSLGYTGWQSDKVFLIQNVHMGNPYIYNGWYRDGKGLNRNQMNYPYLKSQGYDSLFVKPGDGLMNSEYIVYNKEQTSTNFLVWMK